MSCSGTKRKNEENCCDDSADRGESKTSDLNVKHD